MNKHDIIRAWKDSRFRAQLTTEQLADLPESPAGLPMTELEDMELASIAGGARPRGVNRFTRTPDCAFAARDNTNDF